MRTSRLAPAVAVTGFLLATAACAGDTPEGAVAVTASDTGCDVASTDLAAGTVTFAVTNTGDQVTEVYLYGAQDGAFTRIVAEVENIGPGTSRDLTADVAAGEYEIACKPGQTGDGIRTRITVTGDGGSTGDQTAYDREIEVEATASGVEGLDDLTAGVGERVEFVLENSDATTLELEIVDPSGAVVAEIEAAAGATAETVVHLDDAGTWTVKLEGDGVAEIERPLTVS